MPPLPYFRLMNPNMAQDNDHDDEEDHVAQRDQQAKDAADQPDPGQAAATEAAGRTDDRDDP